MTAKTLARLLLPPALAALAVLVAVSLLADEYPDTIRGGNEDGDGAESASRRDGNGMRTPGPGPDPSRAPTQERPTGLIRGDVTGPDRKPLAGIGVTASGDGEDPWTRSARTDRRGAFEIEAPAGLARVAARSRAFLVPEEKEIRVSPGTPATVHLVLRKSTTARLRVLAGDGQQPVEGARVTLTHALTGRTFSARCGPGGACDFAGLPRGEFRFDLQAPGYVRSPASPRVLRIRSFDPELELPLSVSARVSGAVRDGQGRPVSGATVKAVRRGASPVLAETDETGAYAMDVLHGTISLEADHPRFAPAVFGRLRARRGTTSRADILMRPGIALRGTVVTPGGRPVPGAEVLVQRIGPTPDLSHLYPPATAGSDGAYGVEHLGFGDHAAAARAPGYQVSRVRFHAGEGEDAILDITLGGGRRLEGRVQDRLARPVSGARVRASSATGAGAEAQTGEDGRFRIDGLPPGVVSLAVRAEGFGSALFPDIEPGAGAFTVTLRRLGRLAGRVAYEGVGQEGVEVTATGARLSFKTWSAPSGGFRFEGVPPGSYRLFARAEGFAAETGPVEVPAGESAEGTVLRLAPTEGR